jgi:hypothetical protein
MNIGDIIELKKEWRDDPDISMRYYIVKKGKGTEILCRALDTGMPLPPHEVLLQEWCNVIETNSYV